MADQAKLLADLAAAISSINAKLDEMLPVVLELNQCRPGVERAVDALPTEADAPSSSSKPALASKPASAAAATSCIDHLDTTRAIVAEVPARTCSEPKQDVPFQIAGVTTVVLLCSPSSKSASASKPASAAATSCIEDCTCASPFATNTGFVTMVPVTCSSDGLPQQPMAAPVLIGSSSSILTKDGRSATPATWATTSLVAMESLVRSSYNTDTSDSAPPCTREDAHELLEPLSELFHKSEDAVVLRPPRRPPDLEAARDHNCSRELLPRPCPSLACDIEPVQRARSIELVQQDSGSPSEHMAPLSNWSMLIGNLSTPYGYTMGIVLCNPSGIYCLDDVLLFREYWGSASDCVQSAHTYHTTFVWLPCSTISGLHSLVMVSSLELQLLSTGSASCTLLTVLLDSGKFAALSSEHLGVDASVCIGPGLFAGGLLVVCQESSVQYSPDYYIPTESVSRLFSTLDGHLLDFPYRSAVPVCLSYPQELDHNFYSSQPKKLLILNLMRRLDVSYDLFSCAHQYPSCFPGYFVTGWPMQDFVACSSLHQFLCGFSPGVRPVVMLELHLVKSGSPCVYLQEPQMGSSEPHGANLNNIGLNRKVCQLKWSESILPYPCCSIFSSASAWDPGGCTPRAFNDAGLRASRMLRRGECHGPRPQGSASHRPRQYEASGCT